MSAATVKAPRRRRLPPGWEWDGRPPFAMTEQHQAAWRGLWRMLVEKTALLMAEEAAQAAQKAS